MNKKTIITIGLVLVVAFIGYSFFAGSYNRMVDHDVQADKAWADVENVYQMRFDLVDNLVATVKGAKDFEQETLTQVIEARAKASSMNINAENLNEETLQQFQAAQGELSSALQRLLVTVERYPELKATQNFIELQTELSRIEQRINIARRDYNEAVKNYNGYIRRFPQTMLAGIYGFDQRSSFESTPGAEVAPKVDFSN